MIQNKLPSRLLENAVEQFEKLPGIGHKTALRLVLQLLKKEKNEVELFGNSLIELIHNIRYCTVCNNISDNEVCEICTDHKRDKATICIVETVKDVMAIENTQQYFGSYHVLGGVISPIDGVGPADLSVDLLEDRLKNNDVKEIILALSTTMEGDTTNFYIYRRFQDMDIKVSTIARGISVGDELEYADEVTLGRSIVNRTEFTL